MLARLRGGGSALPGLVVERIDPQFLDHALADISEVVVVSGTNGKTTTTRMLVAVLRAHGKKVVTNPTGSNFTRGVISALLGEAPANGRIAADMAVLELDEAHALRFVAVVAPTRALLLNVARDQLDRFAEIDYTADLLRRLARTARLGVVLNRDDSFIARIAREMQVDVRYFGVHPEMADRLPELQEADVRFEDESAAPELGAQDGLLRPEELQPDGTQRFTVEFAAGGHVGPVQLRQRGLAAMINATAAATMARSLLGSEFNAATAAEALSSVAPPFGRGEVIDLGGRTLELVLVKNPAGFTVALGAYGSTPVATMIAINDNTADGRDVSWLYDVSFASLAQRGVSIVSGQRAYDMALRLEYDQVSTDRVIPELEPALDAFLAAHPGQPLRIFCTYTAMMSLRRVLAARYDLSAFGEEGQE
ncbi:Mur ligase family protein [Gephyromycinifex aptenodytis]|uniref:Mur ligase family protein n=1 Tax=Gephyromycinifex aptenodytis TaxID=2716227 RepID=UPI0014454753|nr:Mur ligase family protein [Gephyromycinifex aptenodytis]